MIDTWIRHATARYVMQPQRNRASSGHAADSVGDSSWHARSLFVSDRPGVPIGEVGGGHPACRYRSATVLPEQSAPALS
jgi:hypothetical protein